MARGGVQRLQVTPRVVLPSFGLFFRRDVIARPAILTRFAEAIRRLRMLCWRVASCTAEDSRSMTACGVPAGTRKPLSSMDSKFL
jgi:hypothetical protein